MDKDIKILYNEAMSYLMTLEAKTNKRFFTQKEFEKNMALIFKLKNAKKRLIEKLNQNGR